MKIRVDSNTAKERLTTELDKVQHRCTARTITVDGIFTAVKSINEHLGIPLYKMDGCVVDVDIYAQNFPDAYKFIPQSTHFMLRNRKGKWSVVDIYRGRCRGRHKEAQIDYMRDDTVDAIINKYSTFYI